MVTLMMLNLVFVIDTMLVRIPYTLWFRICGVWFLLDFFNFLQKYQYYKDMKYLILKLWYIFLTIMIVGILISQGQGCGIFRDRLCPLIVKKRTFQEKRTWQVLEPARLLSC